MHISHSVCVEANEVHRLLDLENITLCVHHPVQTQGEVQLRLLSWPMPSLCLQYALCPCYPLLFENTKQLC